MTRLGLLVLLFTFGVLVPVTPLAYSQPPDPIWEGGIYENEYVKENGVWKIKLFNYRVVYQANYETGWAHSPVAPLMVSNFSKPYPENPRGPDEVGPPPPRWPEAVVMPFHYPHPVTGKPINLKS